MLVVLGGLPGVGKTTCAVRLDAVESGIITAGLATVESIGPAGYVVAHTIVRSALTAGLHVVVDAVNPVTEARGGWRYLGEACGVEALLVEVRCDDVAEHQRRIESRTADLPGHQVPTWNDVERLHYEDWHDADLRVDTSRSTRQAVDAILAALSAR